MIRLPNTGTYSLELITAQNGAQSVVSYSDATSSAYTGGTQVASITSATTTTICSTPAASTVRDVDQINIKNTYAGSHTVTVQVDANGTNYPLIVAALLTDESLNYTHGSGWQVKDANGNTKNSALSAMTSAQLAAILTDETGSGAAVFATNPTFASLTNSGNITFTGTGNRITGDFSNGTIASRTIVQSSTANGNTNFEVIPNGTATISGLNATNSSDTANCAVGQVTNANTDIRFQSSIRGAGTYLPMTFYTGGSERVRIDTSGVITARIGTAIPAGGTAGFGYCATSTANFGVFFGSGAPSLSAAKGSLYLRSDGSATNNRMYVNTDGGTTWTAVTTVA